jgi:hypothetical protein
MIAARLAILLFLLKRAATPFDTGQIPRPGAIVAYQKAHAEKPV